MHVYAYALKLEPMLWRPAALTPESLAGRLAGDAVIHEFALHPSGAPLVNIALQRDRDSHEEAMDELLLAVQELGYTFVEAEVTKIADRTIEMAVGLCVGGLGAGATTENNELALIGAFAGWCAGLIIGANMKKVEVMYQVQWTSAGWHFARVTPQPAPSRQALQVS